MRPGDVSELKKNATAFFLPFWRAALSVSIPLNGSIARPGAVSWFTGSFLAELSLLQGGREGGRERARKSESARERERAAHVHFVPKILFLLFEDLLVSTFINLLS